MVRIKRSGGSVIKDMNGKPQLVVEIAEVVVLYVQRENDKLALILPKFEAFL